MINKNSTELDIANCDIKLGRQKEAGYVPRPRRIIEKFIRNEMNRSIAIPDEVVISKIYLIRNQKVMLDDDLAELYQVDTKGSTNK